MHGPTTYMTAGISKKTGGNVTGKTQFHANVDVVDSALNSFSSTTGNGVAMSVDSNENPQIVPFMDFIDGNTIRYDGTNWIFDGPVYFNTAIRLPGRDLRPNGAPNGTMIYRYDKD